MKLYSFVQVYHWQITLTNMTNDCYWPPTCADGFFMLLQALAMNLAVFGERVYKPCGSRRMHFLGLSLHIFLCWKCEDNGKFWTISKHMLKTCDMCKSTWVVKVADTAVSAVSKVVILGPSTPQAWDQNDQTDQYGEHSCDIAVVCCRDLSCVSVLSRTSGVNGNACLLQNFGRTSLLSSCSYLASKDNKFVMGTCQTDQGHEKWQEMYFRNSSVMIQVVTHN